MLSKITFMAISVVLFAPINFTGFNSARDKAFRGGKPSKGRPRISGAINPDHFSRSLSTIEEEPGLISNGNTLDNVHYTSPLDSQQTSNSTHSITGSQESLTAPVNSSLDHSKGIMAFYSWDTHDNDKESNIKYILIICETKKPFSVHEGVLKGSKMFYPIGNYEFQGFKFLMDESHYDNFIQKLKLTETQFDGSVQQTAIIGAFNAHIRKRSGVDIHKFTMTLNKLYGDSNSPNNFDDFYAQLLLDEHSDHEAELNPSITSEDSSLLSWGELQHLKYKDLDIYIDVSVERRPVDSENKEGEKKYFYTPKLTVLTGIGEEDTEEKIEDCSAPLEQETLNWLEEAATKVKRK